MPIILLFRKSTATDAELPDNSLPVVDSRFVDDRDVVQVRLA